MSADSGPGVESTREGLNPARTLLGPPASRPLPSQPPLLRWSTHAANHSHRRRRQCYHPPPPQSSPSPPSLPPAATAATIITTAMRPHGHTRNRRRRRRHCGRPAAAIATVAMPTLAATATAGTAAEATRAIRAWLCGTASPWLPPLPCRSVPSPPPALTSRRCAGRRSACAAPSSGTCWPRRGGRVNTLSPRRGTASSPPSCAPAEGVRATYVEHRPNLPHPHPGPTEHAQAV